MNFIFLGPKHSFLILEHGTCRVVICHGSRGYIRVKKLLVGVKSLGEHICTCSQINPNLCISMVGPDICMFDWFDCVVKKLGYICRKLVLFCRDSRAFIGVTKK